MAKRVIKKKVVKNPKTKRTRNANTLTEAAFFGKIRVALRRTFRFWKPGAIAKQQASRAYKGPNKLQKKEYLCNCCNEWFKNDEIEIDHIVECGSLRTLEDLPGFIDRLCCENITGFQVLCKTCHKEKTKKAKSERKANSNL
jgi:hypothetical protein